MKKEPIEELQLPIDVGGQSEIVGSMYFIPLLFEDSPANELIRSDPRVWGRDSR